MKRRDFILIAAAGVAAISVPAVLYNLAEPSFNPSLARPRALLHIWDAETLRFVGTVYRQQVPAEKRARILLRLLASYAGDNLDANASKLEQDTRKDFETGNTVLVDGWILSVTEARQCALFSTIKPG